MTLFDLYRSMRSCLLVLCFIGFTTQLWADQHAMPSARDLIQSAMDHWRGVTSFSDMTMTIHRSDWQRTMSMKSWTLGDKISLVRVTRPIKNAGNGTLVKDQNMWTFAPKINRVLKIPSSMMGQSWMGSDFSNKDISKSTDVIDQYTHRLIGSEDKDGHRYFTIESVPLEDAAVVWGKEVFVIRDDFIVMRQEFWDQDNILVKQLESLEVVEMGGRTIAKRMRMTKIDDPEEWTDMLVNQIEFDIDLAANLFTLSNLRNPRQ